MLYGGVEVVYCLLLMLTFAKTHSYREGCGCSFNRRLSECSACFDLFQEEEENSRNEDRDIIRPNYEIHTTHCPVVLLNKREGTV